VTAHTDCTHTSCSRLLWRSWWCSAAASSSPPMAAARPASSFCAAWLCRRAAFACGRKQMGGARCVRSVHLIGLGPY
jgi:hypothetical protein